MTPWQIIEEALAHKRPPRGAKWLADELDEAIQTVSNWKKRGVPAKRFREIAKVVGLTLDQLEGLEPLPWDRAVSGEDWPFSTELRQEVASMDATALRQLEAHVWSYLRKPMPEHLSKGIANSETTLTATPAPVTVQVPVFASRQKRRKSV